MKQVLVARCGVWVVDREHASWGAAGAARMVGQLGSPSSTSLRCCPTQPTQSHKHKSHTFASLPNPAYPTT
eukprot:353666-Chlamydomonas_euryale.AAC.1